MMRGEDVHALQVNRTPWATPAALRTASLGQDLLGGKVFQKDHSGGGWHCRQETRTALKKRLIPVTSRLATRMHKRIIPDEHDEGQTPDGQSGAAVASRL